MESWTDDAAIFNSVPKTAIAWLVVHHSFGVQIEFRSDVLKCFFHRLTLWHPPFTGHWMFSDSRNQSRSRWSYLSQHWSPWQVGKMDVGYHWVSQFNEVFVSWESVGTSLENSRNESSKRSCRSPLMLHDLHVEIMFFFWSLPPPWTTSGPDLSKLQSLGGGLQSVMLARELIRERRPPEPEPVENEAQICAVYTCDICIRD